jgi:glycosyltransferase involved in cell wall biosynthesis
MATTSLRPDLDPEPGATFSVIIPTFRRPDLVAEAVASVVAQTRSDWECLVVDDGGADGLDGLDGLDALDADPRVRVIRRPVSGGPAAARNSGLTEARGSIVTFLDDDDRYGPDRLELAAVALTDPTVDVALCWTAWFDSDADAGRPTERSTNTPAEGRLLYGDIADIVLDATTPHLGATAIRAVAVLRFDERYRAAEDVEWWLRTAAASRVATVARVGCELRRHLGTRANGTDVAGRIAASEQMIRDHHGYFATHPRAEAFRLARMGTLALGANDRAQARSLLTRSIRRRPTALAARSLIRTWSP